MAQNKALSLGGIGAPCCCKGLCTLTFCVQSCSVPVPGVTITITGGGSGVTAGSGCVTISFPGPGTYTVSWSGGGIGSGSASLTLGACGSVYVLNLSSLTIHITDVCGLPYLCSTTVTLMIHGGATIGTGSTSTGAITFSWNGTSMGNYDITIVDGISSYTALNNSTITCGDILIYPACSEAAAVGACGYLTDANGTWPVFGTTYYDGTTSDCAVSSCTFEGNVCYLLAGVTPLCDGTNGCPSSGGVITHTPIGYSIGCAGGYVVGVRRSWVVTTGGVGDCYPGVPYVSGNNCFANCGTCGTNFPSSPSCAYGTASYDNCSYAFTANVTAAAGMSVLGCTNLLPDPVGGSVAWSF